MKTIFVLVNLIISGLLADFPTVPSPSSKLGKSQQVSVTKCCLENHSLDISNPKQPRCVDGQSDLANVEIKGIDVETNEMLEIILTKDQQNPSSLPYCYNDYEVFRLETSGKIILLLSSLIAT